MKKLLIALGSIACAIGLQAATVNWQVSQIWLSGEDDSWEGVNAPANWGVYLFDANGTGTSRAEMLGILSATTVDVDAWKTAMGTAVSTVLTAADSTANGSGVTMVANEGEVSGYLVIIDAATLDGATQAYVSELASATDTTPVPVTFNTFGPDADGYVDARSGWYAVPEPTSGLMLLLGMAGLALRRRRA